MHEYEHIIKDDYVKFYLYNRKGKKFTCYVDLEDWDRVRNHKYKWYADPNNKCVYVCSSIYLGYINGSPKYKKITLHRFVLNYDGSGRIDHENYNGLDNRKINHRIVEQENNLKHRQEKNKNNTSGYRNVSWIESEQAYVVQLQVNGKNTRFGKFTDVHEAGRVAEEKRKEIYGDYAGVS